MLYNHQDDEDTYFTLELEKNIAALLEQPSSEKYFTNLLASYYFVFSFYCLKCSTINKPDSLKWVVCSSTKMTIRATKTKDTAQDLFTCLVYLFTIFEYWSVLPQSLFPEPLVASLE